MFLQRVTDLINSHGITRNKLLTDVGLNTNSFVAWEKRGTVPGGNTLAKLADYFHVSTDYLLGRTDDPRPVGDEKEPTPVPEDGLNAEQTDLVRLYDAAPPALRAAALAVLKSAEEQNTPPGGAATDE